jgi:hypothetical protein
VKHFLPRWLCLVAALFIPLFNLPAQQPRAIPPSKDPQIWGCAGHPYVATVEASNTPLTQPGPKQWQTNKVYRNSAGMLRTDTFDPDGRPVSMYFKNPAKAEITWLKVMDKTITYLPDRFVDPASASQFWTVTTLPSRNILGFEASGLRYVYPLHRGHSESGSSSESATVVSDYWFSPVACMILEMHVRNPSVGSQDQKVTSIEQREPDPQLFEIPAGYVPYALSATVASQPPRRRSPDVGCPEAPLFTGVGDASHDDFFEVHYFPGMTSKSAYIVRIYADGRLIWLGESNVRSLGEKTESLKPAQAKAIITSAREFGFGGLCDEYVRRATDGSRMVAALSIGGQPKVVTIDGPSDAPRWLIKMILQVQALPPVQQLIGTNQDHK